MSPIVDTVSLSNIGSQVVPLFVVFHTPPADVHDIRIALHHCEVVDAPAHRRGADLPEFEIFELIGGIRLVAGRRQRGHRQRAKNRPTSQNRPQSIPRMLHFHPPVCKVRHLTPARPYHASSVLKGQTNPLQ
jgi:hypothetical protein